MGLQIGGSTSCTDPTERQTKTRTGAEPKDTRTVKPKMFSVPESDRDPVRAFHLYASKRPEQMNSVDSPFYLAVNLTKMTNSSKPSGFKATPMGVNKLNSLMKTMAQKAGFNAENLTNHSRRKRIIQKLNDQEVPPTHIMQISCHKNVQSSITTVHFQRNNSETSQTSWAVPLQLGGPSQFKKEKMSAYQKTKSHLNKFCPYFKAQTFTEEQLISR